MNAVHSLIPFALVFAAPLAAAMPAEQKLPELSIVLGPAVVEFHVSLPMSPFVGVVIASLSADVQHYLVGLPPLLDQAVVLAAGLDYEGTFSTRFRDVAFPPGIMIYAQGVTIGESGILSSNVGSFVLDASGTIGGG